MFISRWKPVHISWKVEVIDLSVTNCVTDSTYLSIVTPVLTLFVTTFSQKWSKSSHLWIRHHHNFCENGRFSKNAVTKRFASDLSRFKIIKMNLRDRPTHIWDGHTDRNSFETNFWQELILRAVQTHSIFQINVGKMRIRHRTILNLNLQSILSLSRNSSFNFRIV